MWWLQHLRLLRQVVDIRDRGLQLSKQVYYQ
jgi:hypothetical protein